jgi:malate synthase
MLVRNVGHLMTNPAILDRDGNEVPEGIMDAAITALIALHDIGPNGRRKNSRTGSMYVVKPKMHGPEEVAFAVEIFDRTEELVGMAKNTIKMGIMDEERRTTVNLKECIRAAKERIAFINTGFLDPHRRRDAHLHGSRADDPQGRHEAVSWIQAYENWNVDIGLECGLARPRPDRQRHVGDARPDGRDAGRRSPTPGRREHRLGPSPTAATLHATHYFRSTCEGGAGGRHVHAPEAGRYLSIPVATRPNWSPEDIQHELDNNAQGMLGYVVRWIDHGVGCSKVPDINNVG